MSPPVKATPGPPEQDELEALIEEARRRARRRRFGYAAVVVLAALFGMGVYFGSHTGGGSQADTGVQPPASATAPGHSERVGNGGSTSFATFLLPRCSTQVGFDLRVLGLSCDSARKLQAPLTNLAPRKREHHQGPREVVYLSNDPRAAGWTCRARLDHQHGPISYVCWLGDRVLLFKFG
jgi:hypothetical protein